MATVNINSEVTDPFYRYKMPRIVAKVEGKGNGIKTVIVNMVDIAKALGRPPSYPTKYFGCELGAQTQLDSKNDRFIVNGDHDAAKLQTLIDGFIKKFVLCPDCANPETKLTVNTKKQNISQRCIACGYTGMIDMRHKLTTFILKNPPDQEPSTTPSKGGKKSKKDKKKQNGDAEHDRASPEANAQEQMAAQRASGGVVDAPTANDNEDDDDDWLKGEDITEDGIKERMQELSNAAKIMALSDDLEKSQSERLEMFYQFVQSKVHLDPAPLEKELVAEAERLEVKEKAPIVLAELLFSEKILQEIKQYRRLLLRFCHENQKAQKYLLGGIEQLVGKVHKEELLPKTAHILKAFYDLDILEEEVLIEWDSKVSKKYVDKKVADKIHEKATPFIKWLKEAEEEESDSEDDDANLEVVYSTSETVGEKIVPKPASSAPAVEEEEDDIDIDAI